MRILLNAFQYQPSWIMQRSRVFAYQVTFNGNFQTALKALSKMHCMKILWVWFPIKIFVERCKPLLDCTYILWNIYTEKGLVIRSSTYWNFNKFCVKTNHPEYEEGFTFYCFHNRNFICNTKSSKYCIVPCYYTTNFINWNIKSVVPYM